MRSRIVSFVVVLTAALVLAPDLRGQKESKKEELSVRQQVDNLVHNSIKNMRKKKSEKEKVEIVVRLLSDVQKTRVKNARQHVEDEIYFDNLHGSLEKIPLKTFNKKSCDGIKNDILVAYEPKGEIKENDAVSKAFEVLETLCK